MGRTVNTMNNYCMHIYMHLLYNSFHVKLASDITAELSVYFSTKRQKADDCKGHNRVLSGCNIGIHHWHNKIFTHQLSVDQFIHKSILSSQIPPSLFTNMKTFQGLPYNNPFFDNGRQIPVNSQFYLACRGQQSHAFTGLFNTEFPKWSSSSIEHQ